MENKRKQKRILVSKLFHCAFTIFLTFLLLVFPPAECELGPAQACVKTQATKIVLHVMAFSDVILDNFKAFSAHF